MMYENYLPCPRHPPPQRGQPIDGEGGEAEGRIRRGGPLQSRTEGSKEPPLIGPSDYWGFDGRVPSVGRGLRRASAIPTLHPAAGEDMT